MKIGSRVLLSKTTRPALHKKVGKMIGTVIRITGTVVTVKWNYGVTSRHAIWLLIEDDPFPWRSHRTMAEVIRDENEPKPA